jgi:transposase
MLARSHHTNTLTPRFRTPAWHDHHPHKLNIEQRLPADHRARTLDAAVARLDLTALLATYHGTGSDAPSPALLLRVVLDEIRRGRHSPAEWHHDARECEPVRWLLRGAAVARSCWYAFRDRRAPVLQLFQEQLLRQAIDAGLTPATHAAVDGTLVAANASRHKLLNDEALQRRREQLAAAVVQDAASSSTRATLAAPTAARVAPAAATAVPPAAPEPSARPPAATAADTPAVPPRRPAWMATTAAGRQRQQQRLERARQRLSELHGSNQTKWPSKPKKATAIVVSPADPQAVVARDKDKVYRPLYNMPIVEDLDSPLILGYDVFAQPNDTGVLAALLARFAAQAGHALQELLSDGPYASGADLAAAQAGGGTVSAPVPGDGVETPKQIPKRELTWPVAEQTCVGPQGHR